MRNPKQNDFVSNARYVALFDSAADDFDGYGDVEDEKSRRRRRLENKSFDDDHGNRKRKSKRKGRRDQFRDNSEYDY